MVPVRDAGNDELAKIFEDRLDGFPVFGTGFGQAADERAGLDVGKHRILADVAQIIGDPIDGLVRRGAEFLGRHLRGHTS